MYENYITISQIQSLRIQSATFAEVVVLPRRERTASRRIRQISEEGLDTPPVKIEKKFPIFIVFISVVEVGKSTQRIFVILSHQFSRQIFCYFLQWFVFEYLYNAHVILFFMFHPLKRYEIWRFVTVMLIHGNALHLWGNVIMQLILGCLLEVIHHWKRVGIVYVAGVLFGTLAGSVVQPWTFLIGASGRASQINKLLRFLQIIYKFVKS